MNRRFLASLKLLLAALLLVGVSRASALKEMPAPNKVLSALSGGDAFELSAKRAGAMYQLRNLVWAQSEGRDVRNQLTAEEQRLTVSYMDSYGKLSSAALASLRAKGPREATRWVARRLHFETDPALRGELLQRFFSDGARAELRAATQRPDAAPAPALSPLGSSSPAAPGESQTAGSAIEEFLSMYILELLGVAALVVLVTLGVFVARTYNSLHDRLEPVKKSRSNIKVTIDRRCTAINDVLQLTLHFQNSENLVVLKISQDSSASGISAAYQQSAALLSNIQNVANRFPNLQSNEHFRGLMNAIQHIEHEIQQSRQHSNQMVESYNTYLHKFPRVLFARLIGFGREEYVDLDVSQARDTAKAMRVSQSPQADAQLAHMLGLQPPPQLAQAQQAPPQLSAAPAAPAQVAARNGGTSVVQALPNISLRFLSGPLGGRQVPIGAGAIVGREANAAQIVVQDPQVSSAHAWIGMHGQGLIFMDRGSTNGSKVNDMPARAGEQIPIKAGDVISLGNANPVTFVVDQY